MGSMRLEKSLWTKFKIVIDERLGGNSHDANPQTDVSPLLCCSPVRARSDFERLGGNLRDAGPQPDVSPLVGRSPAIARSDFEHLGGNDRHETGSDLKNSHNDSHQTDPTLGRSPAIARSDLESVGPDDHQDCPIFQEGIPSAH